MINYIDIITLKHPGIQGVTYWHTQYDGTPWNDPYDGLKWENKDIPKPSKEQLTQWASEVDLSYRQHQVVQNRQQDYIKEGATVEAMIVALWEAVIEKRPEAADAIQTKRAAVKAKYPKPTV